MGILFLILKIIGCVLLFLVLLFLTILLLVVFAPVAYHGEGLFHQEEKSGRIKVSWLLFFIRVQATYLNGATDFMLRIFGIPIYATDENRWSMLGRKRKTKVKTKTKKSRKKKQKKRQEEYQEDEDIFQKPIEEEEWKEAQKQIPKIEELKEPELDHKNQKKPFSFGKKIVGFVKKCYNTCRSFVKKLIAWKEKIVSIKDLFEDEEIRAAIKRVLSYGKHFLKKVLPRKIQGSLRFGLSDPSQTGKILGCIAVFLPVYEDSLQVIPEFTQEIFEADLKFSGRVMVFDALRLAGKVYFDKDLMKQKDRVIETIGGEA